MAAWTSLWHPMPGGARPENRKKVIRTVGRSPALLRWTARAGRGMKARAPPWPAFFISYRREDAPGSCRACLRFRVRARFGAEVVFMDVTAIDAGADFVERDRTGRRHAVNGAARGPPVPQSWVWRCRKIQKGRRRTPAVSRTRTTFITTRMSLSDARQALLLAGVGVGRSVVRGGLRAAPRSCAARRALCVRPAPPPGQWTSPRSRARASSSAISWRTPTWHVA